jgi:hypothetical protein
MTNLAKNCLTEPQIGQYWICEEFGEVCKINKVDQYGINIEIIFIYKKGGFMNMSFNVGFETFYDNFVYFCNKTELTEKKKLSLILKS